MAEKVQVDIATSGADKAAADLNKVADSAERLEEVDPTVTAKADTDTAARDLRDVARDVEELDGTDATVTAKADTDDAARGLRDVADQADELDGADVTVTAKVDDQTSGALGDIFGELDDLKARAKGASDQLDNVTKSEGGGGHLRGQAIADLTGPLGDVSGQASDLAGVFDGLGDTLAGLGGRFGLSADAIEGALGGISFGVAGAVALWGLFRQAQQKAREELEKTVDRQRELNDLLEQGKFDDAAKKLVDDYGDVYDAAQRAGIPVKEVTEFLAGYSDELPTATARIKDIAAAQHDHGETVATATAKYEQQIDAIFRTKDQIDKANDSIKQQDDRTRQASAALSDNADAADKAAKKQDELAASTQAANDQFDAMRDAVNLTSEFHRFESSIDDMQAKVASGTALASDDIDGLKADIIQLAKDAKANPAEVSSTLDKIDQGDLAAVKADAERYYANRPVQAQGTIDFTRVIFPRAVSIPPGAAAPGATGSAFGFSGAAPAGLSAAATVINVTQYLPRGGRGDPLVAAERAARRSGGLYQRAHR